MRSARVGRDGRSCRPGRPRRLALAPLIALTVLVTACSPSPEDAATRQDVEDLRAQVAALEIAGEERDEALATLATTTRQLERDDPLGRLNETDEQLAQLVDALTVLEEELAIDAEMRAEADEATSEALAGLRATDEDLQGAVSEVRNQIAASRGRIDELAAEVDDLRTLYTTLRDRFDRLQRGS